MTCVYFVTFYMNSDTCFPNFGSARTPYLKYDVYTNGSVSRYSPIKVRRVHGAAREMEIRIYTANSLN